MPKNKRTDYVVSITVFITYALISPEVGATSITLPDSSNPIQQSAQPQNKWEWFRPVLTVSSGLAASRIGQSQTLSMVNDFTTYQYAANNEYYNKMLWGGFLGTEIPVCPQWILQLGLGVYLPNAFSAEGILIQGVDEQSSDLFPYSYKVKNHQFLGEGKLLGSIKDNYHPYVSAGLGVAVNKAYTYSAYVPPFLTFTPQFTNYSTTSFAYSIGAGMDIDIKKNWRLGAGYRFTGVGDANLGYGFLDVIPFPGTLTQSNLYIQEVLVQLTYLMY
ncbi:outer membrane protein [Legionella maioricensis]|uniref:Opacity protein and related surface antigens n=1 Tax=Legionella maioricensis TaxID=2896528 RepID=A0A9X2D1R9_9GAMM|nr:hypothetical protein [Legionella maioricensis]MCL9684823.1 hypothetical protein [Legionella maioricensis]MCL9688503.1 hypothetical protein [Legionella maioricensis]